MIDIPYVIEPPDLLVVEVLEALPGRPISGERLVRPDGTINLGFYGVVHVRGLTLEQAKAKVVEHLRRWINDETLGLVEPVLLEAPGVEGAEKPAKPSAHRPDRVPEARRPVRRTGDPGGGNGGPVTPEGPRAGRPRVQTVGAQQPPASAQSVTTPDGRITITIDVGGASATPAPAARPEPTAPKDEPGWAMRRVAPEDTCCVFLDVTAHNSKVYYVLGDVAAPGKMPVTGKETVLDALNHAGGLLPSADPGNIRLHRPGRNGKGSKTYTVDWEAIRRGEARSNYQLFPGDRLLVARDPLAAAAVHQDLQATALQSILTTALQTSTLMRSLAQAAPELTPAQRGAVLREWVTLIGESSQRQGVPASDVATFRELLLRQMKAVEDAGNQKGPGPR